MAELGFIQKEIELRQNLAGENFTHPPPLGAKISIMGDLTTACDFEEDLIYIFMEMKLPEDWRFNDEDYYDPRTTETDESDLINRKRSITQTVKAVASGEERSPIAHFSFPFNYSLLASNLLGPWPKLSLQVNSVDSWERHRIMGYGFLEFPSTPGFHNVSVQTWRPIESLYAEVHSFYLGGSVRVENPWDLAETSTFDEEGKPSVINRYGLHTQSSGSVQLRFSVISQTATDMDLERDKAKVLNFKQKSELAWRRKEQKAAQVIDRTSQKLTYY